MKTINLLLILFISFCLTGCGGTSDGMKEENVSELENTPESVAVNFTTALYQGDIEKARKFERKPFDSVVDKFTRKWHDMEIIMHILQKDNRNMKINVDDITEEKFNNSAYITLKLENFVNIKDWTRVRGEGKIMLKVHKDSRDNRWIVIDII